MYVNRYIRHEQQPVAIKIFFGAVFCPNSVLSLFNSFVLSFLNVNIIIV